MEQITSLNPNPVSIFSTPMPPVQHKLPILPIILAGMQRKRLDQLQATVAALTGNLQL